MKKKEKNYFSPLNRVVNFKVKTLCGSPYSTPTTEDLEDEQTGQW